MKLIYIDKGRIPTEKAYGYQISKMCEEFGKAGVVTELWIPSRANEIKEDLFEYYNLKKTFTVKTIKIFDYIRYNDYFLKKSYYIFSFVFLLKFLFKKIDKDTVVYTRIPEVAWLFTLKKNKTVFEAHNWPNSRYLYKFFLKRIGAIVVISNGLKNKFIAEGFSEKKILVAPDGVDLELFDIDISKEEARKKLGLPLDKKIAMYTGHLYEWKGAQVLAEAAKLLADNEMVVFVGGTRKDIGRFRDKYGKVKNIIIVGKKPHSEIPIYLKAADVLVLPNSGKEDISRLYTSPLKLFEYMASGRPIVASDVESIREVMNNNCVYFYPNNVNSLHVKLEEVFSVHSNGAQIIKSAYNSAFDYQWSNRVLRINKFIKNNE